MMNSIRVSCVYHFVKLANVIPSPDHDGFVESVDNSYIGVDRFNLLRRGPRVV